MAQKKKSGVFGAVIIYLAGVASGCGIIAATAVYANGLYLPFIKKEDKTPLPALSASRDETRRETVEFQEILRRQRPVPLNEDAFAADDSGGGGETEPARAFAYYLQISAYKNQETAESLRGSMILNGHQAIINTGTLSDGSALHRVWMGPYADEDAAEQKRAQLTLDGYTEVQLLQIAR